MSALAEIAADVAMLGHNNPPEPTAFDAFTVHIGDLFEEAKNHLDSEGIATQAQADAVSKLLDMIRTASKDADKARVEEKKPHDDAAKAVQARWKPLLDKCDLATDACKKALAPYLRRLDEEKRAKEEAARKEAEEKALLAAEAMRAAAVDDLSAREAAEALEAEAKKAQVEATKAANDKAHAKGGARAAGLRTYYHPELVSPSEALRHYVATNPEAVKAFLLSLAEVDVRNGKHQIPGFDVISEQRVV